MGAGVCVDVGLCRFELWVQAYIQLEFHSISGSLKTVTKFLVNVLSNVLI